MTGKRKGYSAEFKAKVALEAIRGELTVAQLVAKHGVHQTLINAWKKQAVEGMAGVFSGKAEAAAVEHAGEIDHLHAKIGQLVVERDFLRRASGR
jgi:transposase